MGCVLTLIGPAALTFVGFLATLWLLRDDHEGVKVCGAFAIIAGAVLLALGSFLAFQLLSPRARREREALQAYTRFQAAVHQKDLDQAWKLTCQEYRRSTTLQRFKDQDADMLATTFDPTVELSSPETAVVYPGMWTGGAHVTMIRSDHEWCLLALSGWSYD